MKACFAVALALGAAWSAPACAQSSPAPQVSTADSAQAQAAWPEAWIEIFKLAPGRQESFMRRVAIADMVSAAGGQPPIQLYVHEDGADWDVLLLKPEPAIKPTPAQEAAMAAKSRELHVPSGPAYFVAIREDIASHTDTKTDGPVTAAQWLGKLDQWRAENSENSSRPQQRKHR